MRDVVFVAVTVAFFVVCVAYVVLCDRIVGDDDEAAVVTSTERTRQATKAGA